MLKVIGLATILLISGCTTMGSGNPVTSFAEAMRRLEAYPQTAETDAYDNAWNDFNNAIKLDERDGCYAKAEGEIQQILQIDATGTVVGYFSDTDNERSRCFRNTYVGVKFPKPPFAPYYRYARMR